jgi:hypothetical protein
MVCMCRRQLITYSQIQYVCVAAPERTNYCREYWMCQTLSDWIQDIANDCYIGCDNAYPLFNKILVPFKANQIAGDQYKTARDAHKISYNSGSR